MRLILTSVAAVILSAATLSQPASAACQWGGDTWKCWQDPDRDHHLDRDHDWDRDRDWNHRR
jgi:Ni/Co efflux regulator RcnB